MLFRKDIHKLCVYCKHAARIDDNTLICRKKGIVNRWDYCRAFRYDPLKRVPEPPAQMQLPDLGQEDYSL